MSLGGQTMALDWVQLPCHGCSQSVYPNPAHMTMVVDNGNGIYTFTCPNCGPRIQQAHPWLVAQLAHAGVPVTDPADVLAAAMADDDAVADEMEGWSEP